uniref:Uncharacterized protein n=1 Tax=Phytophthora ramorum TaxID=164328 RepID=H3H006_PHYRM
MIQLARVYPQLSRTQQSHHQWNQLEISASDPNQCSEGPVLPTTEWRAQCPAGQRASRPRRCTHTATTATTVSTTEEASFSTDFGAPADFSPPTDFSAPENFTAPADLSTPADGPAFDGGVEAERDVSFGGEAQPVFGGSGTADDGVAGTVSGRTESFSAETLHAATTATTATTVSTTEEASFSTDFGAPADFSPPTDFSAPENFTAPADLSTPADGPAFDGGVEAERDVSFGGEAQPVFGGSGTADDGVAGTVFGGSGTADDGVAGTVSGRTESFSAETLHAATTATTATTVSTTEEASFSTDFGAPVSVNCVDDAGAGTTVLNRIEMDSFHPGMVESAENEALSVESGSVAGGDFTFDVDEYDEAGGKPLKYFSETNEYEVSTVLNSTPCTHVSEKQSTDGRLDDEFDEIFGDTPATQSETVSSVEVTTSSGKYDADFDDIFGESQTESGSATNSEAFVASAAESNGDSAASTEGAAIEKKHNILDNEDQTAPGVEVRTGTPASDFTFR